MVRRHCVDGTGVNLVAPSSLQRLQPVQGFKRLLGGQLVGIQRRERVLHGRRGREQADLPRRIQRVRAHSFGLAVIAAPVLFFIDPAYVPAPVTLCALSLSLWNALSFREGISLSGLQAAIIGRVPGSLAGAALLLWIDQGLLALWIGVSVLLAVAVSLSSLRWQPTRGRMMAAGFMSGFMGTSSSIGGPPMALLWQHQDISHIRANLAAFFVLSCQ